jgi:hypothetical protein
MRGEKYIQYAVQLSVQNEQKCGSLKYVRIFFQKVDFTWELGFITFISVWVRGGGECSASNLLKILSSGFAEHRRQNAVSIQAENGTKCLDWFNALFLCKVLCSFGVARILPFIEIGKTI